MHSVSMKPLIPDHEFVVVEPQGFTRSTKVIRTRPRTRRRTRLLVEDDPTYNNPILRPVPMSENDPRVPLR